uniref:Uncharacterized protein n=1 Tax=Cacopsylla melanoneura TaxID=428564 RepID=A0A8D8ZES3_9HEMI
MCGTKSYNEHVNDKPQTNSVVNLQKRKQKKTINNTLTTHSDSKFKPLPDKFTPGFFKTSLIFEKLHQIKKLKCCIVQKCQESLQLLLFFLSTPRVFSLSFVFILTSERYIT